MKPRFKIGDKYLTRGKRRDECVIIDIYTTNNAAGEIVKINYVSQHSFCGQVLTNRDVCETTVAMGFIDNEAAK